MTDFDVEAFLQNNPVPFSGTPQWQEWQRRCDNIPLDITLSILEVLRSGPAMLHYQAMMILRMRGYFVIQVGEGVDAVYEIKHPDGTEESVVPKYCPRVYDSYLDFENSDGSTIRFKKD